MKVLTRLTWGSAKFWLGAIVVVAAALAVARDRAPANAADPEILPSLASGSPTWASSGLLVVGGSLADNTPCVPGDHDPTTLCLYIWAKDVYNATGASAFQVHYTYAGDRIAVGALTASRTWLGSSGRSAICNPPTMNPGSDSLVCDTIMSGATSGATGSGILATVALSSKSVLGSTTLDLSTDTYLLDTPLDPNNLTHIPATVRSISLYVAPCADLTGDGVVHSGDITYVVRKYNTNDPAADLNGSGLVRSDDITIAVREYSATCRR